MGLIFPAIVFAIWVVIRIVLPNMPIEMDFDQAHGSFIIFLDKWLTLGRSMVVMDLLLAWIGHNNDMASHVCLAGAVSGILFCVWLTYCYERYMHQRYPRNGAPGISIYTPNRYATTLALGAAALGFTVVGVVAVLQ